MKHKILAFRIGRGGRFNEPGFLTFVGEKEIGYFTGELFTRFKNEMEVLKNLQEKFGEKFQKENEHGEILEDVFLNCLNDKIYTALQMIFGVSKEDLGEIEFVNANGNAIGLTQTDVDSGIGRIEFDGDFDTVYTKLSSELTNKELDAIGKELWYDSKEIMEFYLRNEKIQQAKEVLRNAGFFVDNLFTVHDVKSKFDCTDHQAHAILSDVFRDETLMADINEKIEFVGDYNVPRKK